jgi:DNA-binding transcriptional LysR family regulator
LSRKLGTTRIVLVASPGYLAKFGSPKNVNALKSHRCLDLGSAARSGVIWRFQDARGGVEVPINCAITANNELALILAACMDEGILCIPELLVGGELANGRLKEILPNLSDPREWGIYAVFHHRNPPAKVRAFIDFVAQELVTLQTVDRWAPFDLPQAELPIP